MLTGIEVRNKKGKLVLTLPVAASKLGDPYITKDIEGLGPVKADISTAGYANHDGGVLQASRVGLRNITFKVGYRPDYRSNQSVQTLRRELYSYFPPKGEVRLRILSDDYQSVDIVGTVESHDPVLFTQDPEVQISVLCVDPDLKAITETSISSFNNLPIIVSYFGTSASGFLFELFVNRPVSLVTLKNNVNPNIVYSTPLIAGDVLSISTIRGDKYVRRTRGGVVTDDLDGLTAGSLSMVFDSETESFYATIAGANDIPYRVTFTPRYVGV